jgi:hypothetical protein
MSQQTRTTPSPTASFQHQCRSACQCPIHADGEPFTAPLGLQFADHVTVEAIQRETAAAIYEAHHSYMDSLPSVNLVHHGIRFQDNLVGAITYRYPVNYPTLLALTRSLRVGLPASKTRFAGTGVVPAGSAVSTGVPSE